MARSNQEHNKDLKVAIVHDWLIGGGAERVVYELHRMFPEAPIYTSYCSDEWRRKLDGKVVTGYLQHWPFNKLRKILQLLRIQWFENLDFSGYDLVISSSGNGEAIGVKAGSKFHDNQTYMCYCHTPTHFYWRHYNTYMTNFGLGVFNPLARLGLRLLIKPLRKWDYQAAQRPDLMIANSSHIQADIKRYYNRDSTVIFPPVDTKRFAALPTTTNERKGFVTVGRQVPQKKTDIIIDACTKLNLPLTVVGSGPEHSNLVKRAGSTVTFVTGPQATEAAVNQALSSAQVFIFAALDDFGITPIEAMAAGTPVLAYKAGGALDYVQPGITGEFFADQSVESLIDVLQTFNSLLYRAATIQNHALRYSSQHFRKSFSELLQFVTK